MTRLALLMLLLVTPLAAQLAQDEAVTLFDEANAAYRTAESFRELDPATAREHYSRAALRYERLIRDGGLENGRLYFNLANSLLGAGDYGRAILNYRRALLYLPDDPLVEHNLTLARRQRSANLGVSLSTTSGSGLSWSATAPYQAVAFLALWAFAWGLLSYRRLKPGKARRSIVTTAFAGAGVLFAMTIASASQFGQQHGVVTAKQSIARQGDGMGYQPALAEPLQPGAEFRISESSGEWSRVALPSGESVWLSRRDFDVVEDIP